jgi:hypothetical protein|tara:strand:- start:232 stop:372 length:141 start_codon:yes stop_codon:yes gene_type:complete
MLVYRELLDCQLVAHSPTHGLQDGSLELPYDDLLAEFDGNGPDIPF